VDHLFTSAPATLDAATATSLVFLVFGMLAVASSLQQIYEKVFGQDHHRGLGELSRLLTWIVVLCGAVVVESLAERPVSTAAAGGWLAPLVTVAIMTPFFWWTMHFLLAGRVAWRTLLPSALITGVFYGGLGVFSKFYFSETIISDSKTYGTIGAIFGIMYPTLRPPGPPSITRTGVMRRSQPRPLDQRMWPSDQRVRPCQAEGDGREPEPGAG
jgi:membrane protein